MIRSASAAALLLATSACAGGTTPPRAGPMPRPASGVPGFDTRVYPGDAALARWRDQSPYRWVGFYLPAPCYTGTTWQGKRPALEAMRWGIAVIFVGEQDWPEHVGPAPDSEAAAPACTRGNLTPEKGRVDAVAATRAAQAEGFPEGTIIYLDVERVDSVAAPLTAYVRAWSEALLQGGRYVPGLYAHAGNAPRLLDAVEGAFGEAGRPGEPSLWVVATNGFHLRRGPAESGFPDARVWQGQLDVRESWGGVELPIDVNVATSSTPSAAGG